MAAPDLNRFKPEEDKPLMAGQGAPLFPQQNKNDTKLFQQANTPAPPGEAPPPPPITPLTTAGGKGSPLKKILFIALGILGILFVVLLMVSLLRNQGSSVQQQDEVELTWWGLWEDPGIVQPLIDEYEAAHPKTKIKYVRQSKEDYRERLTSALASGQGPDIFRLHNTWVPMFLPYLNPLPSSVMSAQEFSNTFYPVAASNLTTSSGIMGIPLEFDGLALYINEDIFTTYAVSPPRNWDDFKALAKELTISDRQGITQAGAAIGLAQNVDHWEDILGLLYLQNGADPADPEEARAKQALTFYTELARVDRVWNAAQAPSTTAFASGRVAMYIGPSWRVFDINKINPELNYRIEPIPQILKPEGDPDITYATYWFEGVSSKSPGQAQAWDFLKFMSTRESLEKLYANASKTRAFGEPYPRLDMRDLLLADPFVGPFLQYAPNARSWYLASRTFDGDTGINSQLSAYFKDAVNAASRDGDIDRPVKRLKPNVATVLKHYGIGTR
jgi:ABC-type glycerol-3-phosphate transport system substrate-binding protein